MQNLKTNYTEKANSTNYTSNTRREKTSESHQNRLYECEQLEQNEEIITRTTIAQQTETFNWFPSAPENENDFENNFPLEEDDSCSNLKKTKTSTIPDSKLSRADHRLNNQPAGISTLPPFDSDILPNLNLPERLYVPASTNVARPTSNQNWSHFNLPADHNVRTENPYIPATIKCFNMNVGLVEFKVLTSLNKPRSSMYIVCNLTSGEAKELINTLAERREIRILMNINCVCAPSQMTLIRDCYPEFIDCLTKHCTRVRFLVKRDVQNEICQKKRKRNSSSDDSPKAKSSRHLSEAELIHFLTHFLRFACKKISTRELEGFLEEALQFKFEILSFGSLETVLKRHADTFIISDGVVSLIFPDHDPSELGSGMEFVTSWVKTWFGSLTRWMNRLSL